MGDRPQYPAPQHDLGGAHHANHPLSCGFVYILASHQSQDPHWGGWPGHTHRMNDVVTGFPEAR